MTGLNDQFFLADDSVEPKNAPAITIDAFKDTTEPGDVPELRDDLDLIAVATEEFEIKLRDLSLLQELIHKEGGMCKHIALEAHAIMPEFLSDDRPIEYFTKTPSRTQLAAALEDIGNEKKSLIKRMIDTIVAFIKKIVKRIKDFFIVDEEQRKADQEFAKNYKGPTEGDLTKTTPQQDSGKTATQAKQSSSSSNDSKDSKSKASPQTTNRDEWTDNKMALISAMLGKDRIAIVAALMESDFCDHLHKAIIACDSITKTRNKPEAYKHGLELEKLTAVCNQALAQAASLDEKEQRSRLMKWVVGKDHASISRIVGLYTSEPTVSHALNDAKDYLEDMEAEVEHWKNNSDPDAAAIAKDVQRLVSQLAAFISVLVKVDNTFSTVIKGLRK